MSHAQAARVVRWIDGDTVVLDVDAWPGIQVTEHIRLAGYDAPEAGKPGYWEAKNRALELAPIGSTVEVVLTETHRRSFIRYVGQVIPPYRAASISTILTEEHLTKADFQ